jgi:hypothetical protein
MADRGFSKSRIAGARQEFFLEPLTHATSIAGKQKVRGDSAELVLPEQDPSAERVTR